MSWAKVDDQWFAHPKVVGLSLAARGLWITTLSWSCAQRTDHLPAYMVRFLAGGEDIDPMVKELVEVGLWIEDGEGWAIHDWDEYQNLSLSEKRARAGKKGAEKRWGDNPPENGKSVCHPSSADGKSEQSQTGEREQVATPPDNGKSWQTDSKPNLPSMANGMAGARPGPSRPVPTQEQERRSPELPLPDDWEPNDSHRELASEERVDLEREAAKFRDYAEANDRRQRDWDASFRTWLRRAREFGAPSNGAQPKGREACPECGAYAGKCVATCPTKTGEVV